MLHFIEGIIIFSRQIQLENNDKHLDRNRSTSAD